VQNIFGYIYGLFLVGLFAILVQMRLNDGAVLILSFDGDALHMAQIVLRMAEGQIPHQDFVTPLGLMAFLPIVWLSLRLSQRLLLFSSLQLLCP